MGFFKETAELSVVLDSEAVAVYLAAHREKVDETYQGEDRLKYSRTEAELAIFLLVCETGVEDIFQSLKESPLKALKLLELLKQSNKVQGEDKALRSELTEYFFTDVRKGRRYNPRFLSGAQRLLKICHNNFSDLALQRIAFGYKTKERDADLHNLIDSILTEAIQLLRASKACQEAEKKDGLRKSRTVHFQEALTGKSSGSRLKSPAKVRAGSRKKSASEVIGGALEKSRKARSQKALVGSGSAAQFKPPARVGLKTDPKAAKIR
jgi:hypothetical protein